MSERFTLHHGDCIQIMRSMPDACVDSVVTDPPYELGFMGKSWDASGIAFNTAVWSEALRVLKPGGHLLAFSGSRTYHRMAVAIEDAGFEIRDQIMWIYGSGFPKSLDVSKAIDKAAGAEREVVGINDNVVRASKQEGGSDYGGFTKANPNITAPATPKAQKWSGYGTALKPAHEPIVVARKPLQGTVAANVLAHGVGALNIDACRVGIAPGDEPSAGHRTATFGTQETQSGGDGSGGWNANTQGRWPANVIHDGSDEVVALFPDTNKGTARTGRVGGQNGLYENGHDPDHIGTWYGDSGSAARFFYCAKANKRDRNEGLDGFTAKFSPTMNDGIGGKEHNPGGDNPRNRGVNKRLNHHPTVKPTDLMRYLIRLVTPQGATILDPFMGSGSTGKAAMYEGVNFIGIEQDADYLAIAQARIEYALNKPLEDQLFERTTPTTEQLIAQNQLAFPLVEGETA